MAKRVNVFQLIDTGGTLISVYATASGADIYTEGINTERRVGQAAMWLSGVGTIQVAKEVSVDNSLWQEAYDQGQRPAGGLFIIHAAGSAGVFPLHSVDSNNVIAPWTRFKFTTAKGATIHGVSYMQVEE